jgi:hypothetical protein
MRIYPDSCSEPKIVITILFSNSTICFKVARVVNGIDSGPDEPTCRRQRSHGPLQQRPRYAFTKIALIERIEWGVSHLYKRIEYLHPKGRGVNQAG